MLILKLQYFVTSCEEPTHVKSQLIGKDPDAEKYCRPEEKGVKEDEMVGWYYRLNGYESE